MGRTVEGRVVIEMTAEARAAIETTDVARAKMIGMIAEPRMIKMTVVRRKLTDEGIGTEAGPRKVIEIGGVRKMTSEGDDRDDRRGDGKKEDREDRRADKDRRDRDR